VSLSEWSKVDKLLLHFTRPGFYSLDESRDRGLLKREMLRPKMDSHANLRHSEFYV